MIKYKKYKDSGFEWIGEIPEHWEITRLATFGTFAKGKGIPRSELKDDGFPAILYGDIYTKYNIKAEIVKNHINEETTKTSVEIEKGDLLFTGSGETVEDIGKCIAYIGDETVYAGGDIIILRQKNYDSLFLSYSLSSNASIFQKASMAKGQIIIHIYASNLREIVLPTPKKPEQTSIANYLDRKTAEIDELVKQKEQLLKLYEEEKTAIINQAVTKGLTADGKGLNDYADNNKSINEIPKSDKSTVQRVKMKDSGINWLGKIPEHWEVKRVATFGSFSKGKGIPRSELKDDGFPAILYGDIYTKYNIKAEIIKNHISKETTKTSVEIYKGDLLFTGSGETVEDIGKCIAYVGDETIYAGGDVIILRQKKHNSLFLSYSLSSNTSIYQKASMAKGQIIIHIYASNLREIILPIPPLEEQTTIVQYIETEINRLNIKSEKTKKLIDLLGEYKKSLISEVVTGKVKII